MTKTKWTSGPWKLESRGGHALTGVEAEIAEMEDCEAYALREISIVAPEKPTSAKRYNQDTSEWDIPVPTTISQITFDPRNDGTEEKEANAHLISASPELFEALDGIVQNIDVHGEADETWFVFARATLAKARGETVQDRTDITVDSTT